MRNMFLRLPALALLCSVAACQHISPATGHKDEPFRLTDDERALMTKRLNGAERPRLALAMSGGGIRSSLYNFGVMKALYDDGVLDDVDLISSVSGGSYLTYWLYSEQIKNPSRPLGESIFADEHFAARLCEFTGSGNFVTLSKMIGSLVVTPVYWDAGRNLYERQMRWVFGGSDSKANPLHLRDLQSLISRDGQPYLIMNATTFGVRFNDEPWTRRVFEMTPLHYGSLSERTSWNGTTNEPFQLIQAALSSGAAIRPLKRRFIHPLPSDERGYTYLWDGGRSENLGAASALRRGPDALIVVDAQLDPKKDPFEAYHILRDRMDDLGMSVQVDGVTGTKRAGVYTGTATRGESRTAVVYIKMERPARILEKLSYTEQTGGPAFAAELREWEQAYQAFDVIRGDYVGGEWQCDSSLGPRPSADDLMYFNLAAYIGWSDGSGLYRQILKRDIPIVGPHDFPRTTTLDQSMYLNQSLAYIALGYLTAKGQVASHLSSGH